MSSIKHRSTRKPAPATPAPKSVQPSDSLVFAAKWSDGTETRMSIYTTLEELDVARGVAVSRAAYSSRRRVPMTEIVATIVQASFEKDCVILQSYTSEEVMR
jgi:hypothetical protein